MYSLSFATPTDIHNQLSLELANVNITGGTATAILANFPTGSTFPTFAQIQASEILTLAQLEIALNTARASGNPNTVAAVWATWGGFVGFQGFFDAVREWTNRTQKVSN